MEFLKVKSSELTVGMLLLYVFLVAAAAFVVGAIFYNMVTTDNIVVTASNGSYLKKSFMGPLSADAKQKLGAATDAAIAKQVAAAAPKS